jgi:hypothetical protein
MRRDRQELLQAKKLAEAIDALGACSRAFTRRNLYHRFRRLVDAVAAAVDAPMTFEAFVAGPLAKRTKTHGPIPNLLPPSTRWDGTRLPREWDSYFPKSILVVDRPEILDLFIASGVITTGRLAVICIDGSPSNVVDWLRRGFHKGMRAPVGYLHDAATAFYPFAVEPLRSLVACSDSEPIDYTDLGLPARGALAKWFPRAGGADESLVAGDARPAERIVELEALSPYALVAFAARRLGARVPGDPRMAPLIRTATAT